MTGRTLAVVVGTFLGLGLAFGAVGCSSNDGKLKVTGLDPRSGDASGGQMVLIHGQGFQKTTRNAKVYFGDKQGNVVEFRGDDEMLVEAPGGKPGDTVDVLVVFEPGGELTIPKAFKFVEKQDLQVNDLGTKKKDNK